MQSDESSFYGDVVLKSFNKAFRDKDSIFDRKYEKRTFLGLYYGDFNFKSDRGKCISKEIQPNKELIKLGFSATVVLVCIFELCYKELKSS